MSDDSTVQMAPTRIQNAKHFGALIRAARQAAGMTVAELAERCYVSGATQSYRESARSPYAMRDAVSTLETLGYALVVVPIDAAIRPADA